MRPVVIEAMSECIRWQAGVVGRLFEVSHELRSAIDLDAGDLERHLGDELVEEAGGEPRGSAAGGAGHRPFGDRKAIAANEAVLAERTRRAHAALLGCNPEQSWQCALEPGQAGTGRTRSGAPPCPLAACNPVLY